MLNLFQHPRCGEPIALASCLALADSWTLKQVGSYSIEACSRHPRAGGDPFALSSREPHRQRQWISACAGMTTKGYMPEWDICQSSSGDGTAFA